MPSERDKQRAKTAADISSWQFLHGTADQGPLAPRTARLGALCAQHHTAAHASSQHDSARASSDKVAHAHGGTDSPVAHPMQAVACGARAHPMHLVMPAGTDAMSPPETTRQWAAQTRSDADVDSILAAALARHVQQSAANREPQRSSSGFAWPEHAFRSHLFPCFSPATSALPPYDDTVSPGIQYIEDEVVGPVPPAEPMETAHLMTKVKVEPCTSLHDRGTGDSQGCSHTVANVTAVPAGPSAPEAAAVDCQSPLRPPQAAPAIPPPMSAGGACARAPRDRVHAAEASACTTDPGEQFDALAILADVALAEANEVDEIAAALEGRPAPDPQAVPEAPIAASSGSGREEVRKTRCLPLSALMAPVAPQKKGGKASPQAKKRKASQSAKPTRRSAASEPHKAQRTTQALPKAAAAQPGEKAASDEAAHAKASQPSLNATQPEAVTRPSKSTQPQTAQPKHKGSLPPLAAAPPPAVSPLQHQISEAAQPAPSPQKPARRRTGQLAAMQAKKCASASTKHRKVTRSQTAGVMQDRSHAETANDVPGSTKDRPAAANPLLGQGEARPLSTEKAQSGGAQEKDRVASTAAGQKVAGCPSAQLPQARSDAASQPLHVTAAQYLLAQVAAGRRPGPRSLSEAAAVMLKAVASATPLQRPSSPGLAAGQSAPIRQIAAAAPSKHCDPATGEAATVLSDNSPNQPNGSVSPPVPGAAAQSEPGETVNNVLKPTSASSADQNRTHSKNQHAVMPADPAVSSVKAAHSQPGATPTAADESASPNRATTPAAQDATMPANLGKEPAMPLAGNPDQAQPGHLDDLETAKMAVKLQMQVEKEVQRAEAAKAATIRTRKRRAPLSHTYPLLDGIPKRKGVYYRKKESSFEAQLDTSVFKVAHHISGGRIIYLGLYTCKPDDKDSVYSAMERATRAVDRTKVKLLEGCMTASDLARHLQFPLSDYQTPEEVDMRKARTLKEFANFLKIKSDAKRPQHGKKGVAARTRRSGAVIYEARITHIPIGSFGTYGSLEAAKQAFDLGAILCKGVDWQINEPLTEYMLDGAFYDHVHIPEHVIGCIQKYLNGMKEVDAEKHSRERSRIMGYFRDRECPFY